MEFCSGGHRILSSLSDMCGEDGSSMPCVDGDGCDVCFCGNGDVDDFDCVGIFQTSYTGQSAIDLLVELGTLLQCVFP